MLCSFIVLMPVRVTELRNRGEEVAREVLIRITRGVPLLPSHRQDFGDLMKLVSDIERLFLQNRVS